MANLEQKVLFIIGGGPRIGHAVARTFLRRGYRVAIGRRSTQEAAQLDGALPVYLDVTKQGTIEAAFDEVEAKLGVPDVVVYNAAYLTIPEEPQDPFSVAPASFSRDLAVNVDGAYAALHQATRRARHRGSSLVFIATGNVTPFHPNPLAVTLGSGKAALAHIISIGSAAYDPGSLRVYFASQVTAEGHSVPYPQVHADAHGEIYWKVATGELGQHGWDLRFAVGSDGSPEVRQIQT